MATNLAIDDRLIEEAKTIGNHRTKKGAVTEALQEYIQRKKQFEITKLFSKIDYDPDYDYKQQRSKQERMAFRAPTQIFLSVLSPQDAICRY